MAPRKRPRTDNGEASSSRAADTPLKPSEVATSQTPSPPKPSTSATPSSCLPEQSPPTGMAPPPLPQISSGNKPGEGITKGGLGNKTVQKTRSWYGAHGTLSRKSTASLSIQKDTVVNSSPLKAGSTPDLHRYDLKRTGNSSSRSRASSASINVTSNLNEPIAADAAPPSTDSGNTHTAPGDTTGSKQPETVEAGGQTDGAGTTTDTPMPDAPSAADTSERPTTSSGWLGGWFGWTAAPPEDISQAETQAPSEPPKEAELEPPAPEAAAPASNETQPEATISQRAASWLWPYMTTGTDESGEVTKAAESTPAASRDADDVPMEDAPPSAASQSTTKPSAGSTWAFFSRDKPKTGHASEPSETGELAVVGERSERHPKRANSNDMGQDVSTKAEPPNEPPLQAKKDKGKKPKRTRPQPMDLDEIPSRPETPVSDAVSLKTTSPSKAKSKTPTAANKSATPNLLLPSFRGTYRMKDNPSIVKQIAALLLRTQQPTAKHVFLVKDPPKIRKAVVIGVHGLYPATYIRSVIGQPTGTSVKFVKHGADAIRRWANDHGCADDDLVIEKAALEGEGMIMNRVSDLWNLLQNWMDHIRSADFILFACHSQGVPVSLMLLQMLIESGAVGRAKLGVCAMAGVSLGPFPHFRSGASMLMGTAAELWQFADEESEVSKRYEAALKYVLNHGARITYIGSIDDQLIPLESALFAPASHPYLYRAIFIDGRLHAPDFIAHLVGFACKLRNLGVSDHGLIRELSASLAGSFFSGEGHSRLYGDDQLYDLAVRHALETTNIGTVPCTVARQSGPVTPSPYYLPWIMRGLLEEDIVKTTLNSETEALLKQFDDWNPTTKGLKDVKLRLEVVRSRL